MNFPFEYDPSSNTHLNLLKVCSQVTRLISLSLSFFLIVNKFHVFFTILIGCLLGKKLMRKRNKAVIEKFSKIKLLLYFLAFLKIIRICFTGTCEEVPLLRPVTNGLNLHSTSTSRVLLFRIPPNATSHVYSPAWSTLTLSKRSIFELFNTLLLCDHWYFGLPELLLEHFNTKSLFSKTTGWEGDMIGGSISESAYVNNLLLKINTSKQQFNGKT